MDPMYELEMSHMRKETRESEAYMSTLLADGFIEYQSSGGIIGKEQVIQGCCSEGSVRFEVTGFTSKRLSDTVALNTYHSITVTEDGHRTYANRSSVWQHASGRWQMVFHQGTLSTPIL